MFRNSIASTSTIVVSPAIAAGSTAVSTLTAIDMQNAEGVDFVVALGTLTATQVTSIKLQQSSDNGVVDDFTDIAGSLTGPAADGDSGKALRISIWRPQKRYVKLYINRGTANAVINSVVATVYNLRIAPPTADTSISASKALVSPAEGTA